MHLSRLLILYSAFVGVALCHRNRDFRLQQDLAMLHVEWVSTEGECNLPKPQIIYPPSSATKLYYPRGTILYRCNDQTGCCSSYADTCGPVQAEQIEVIFFVTHVNDHHRLSSQKRRGQTSTTEVRKMTNHTKCGCRNKSSDKVVQHDDIQEVVSRPLVNNQSKTASILLLFMSLFSVIVIVIAFVFLYKKCRDAQNTVVAAY